MKSRWFIAGALVFALIWAPAVLRASAKSISTPSCQVAKSHFGSKQAGVRTSGSRMPSLASVPGHQTPSPRLHRTRGKKINIDGSVISALKCFATPHYLVADTWLSQQDPDGLNPSRGPPSQISL